MLIFVIIQRRKLRLDIADVSLELRFIRIEGSQLGFYHRGAVGCFYPFLLWILFRLLFFHLDELPYQRLKFVWQFFLLLLELLDFSLARVDFIGRLSYLWLELRKVLLNFLNLIRIKSFNQLPILSKNLKDLTLKGLQISNLPNNLIKVNFRGSLTLVYQLRDTFLHNTLSILNELILALALAFTFTGVNLFVHLFSRYFNFVFLRLKLLFGFIRLNKQVLHILDIISADRLLAQVAAAVLRRKIYKFLG